MSERTSEKLPSQSKSFASKYHFSSPRRMKSATASRYPNSLKRSGVSIGMSFMGYRRPTVELTRRRESKHPSPHQAIKKPRSRRSRPTICWASWFRPSYVFVDLFDEIGYERFHFRIILLHPF